MIKVLYDENVILFVLAFVSFIGVLANMIFRAGCMTFLQAAKSIMDTQDKYLKKIKQKYEDKCKKKENVYNVDSFVDKCVYNYKYCGLKLLTLKKICGQIRIITIICAVFFSVYAGFIGCEQKQILLTICTGVLCIGVLEIFRKNVDNYDFWNESKVYMIDCFENVIKVKYIQAMKKDNEPLLSKLNGYLDKSFDKREKNLSSNSKQQKIQTENLKTEKFETKDVASMNEEENLTQKEKVIRINKIDNSEKNKKEEQPLVNDNKVNNNKNVKMSDKHTEESSIINEILKEFLA